MNDNSICFVTASDSSHHRSQLQLISSIREHFRTALIFVVDLGRTDTEKGELSAVAQKAEYTHTVAFPFFLYPSHYDIRVRCGEYAWKPAIVCGVSNVERSRYLCWLDAGCKVTGDFVPEIAIAAEKGIYSSITKGTLGEYTDHRTLEAMGVALEDWGVPMRAACGLVFDLENERTRKMIYLWAKAASVHSIIAPPGCSPAKKHRYDQSLYTALTRDIDTERHGRYSWKAHQDIDQGSTRNRKGYAE